MILNDQAFNNEPQALLRMTAKNIETSAKNLSQQIDGLLVDQALTQDWDRVSVSLAASHSRLNSTLGQAPDLVIRMFTIGPKGVPAMLVFENGQVDNGILDRDTMIMSELAAPDVSDGPSLFKALNTHFLGVGHVSTEAAWSKILPKVMEGATALFIDGVAEVMLLDTTKFPARSISHAQSEPSIKGPQEAFTEVLLTQMNQMRRRLPSPKLTFESFQIGSDTNTTVVCAYMSDLTNPDIVAAVKQRLAGIKRDSVQTSNEIGEYLADRRLTIFPQVRYTERVDLVARNLGQGKVAVLTANDPTAMLVPNTLMDFYQTTQDYALPFWDATLMRTVRLIGLAVGLYLMPLYIALSSVNPDLLPAKLLLTIDGARQGIPFPPVLEVIIMWAIIEILREAANRLPQQLATTIGTVGAVVVGTAIVKAGIVDSLMIIIVTLTALGLFTVPAIEIASTWRWLFWVFIIAAWIFGIYGIVLLTVVVIAHLTSLENFGVPYLSPFGPLRLADLADSWVRFPFPALKRRPVALRTLRPQQATTETIVPQANLYAAQQRFQP